jgi:hypothetical protein
VHVGLGSEDPGVGQIVTVGPIANTPAKGTVRITKTGLNAVRLNGATFTLYKDDGTTAGSLDNGDHITTLTCTTAGTDPNDGKCNITDVPLGDYIVVETTVPAGYTKAPDQAVNVGVGGVSPGVGDVDSLSFSDPVVNGTVRVTKKDDADNLIGGATFTLYTDVAGTKGSSTGKTCSVPSNTTTGQCDITDVVPATYWVVETTTPSHYETAADQKVTVGIGSAPGEGATAPVTLVDARKHRVVVLVCHEGTDTLLSRDVTVGSTTKASKGPGSLTDAQQKVLCDTDGANFGDIGGHGTVAPSVNLAPAH